MASILQQIIEAFDKALGQSCRAQDDFFDLGGDSLVAEALMTEVSQQVGFEVPLYILLDHPTPMGLANHLDGLARPANTP